MVVSIQTGRAGRTLEGPTDRPGFSTCRTTQMLARAVSVGDGSCDRGLNSLTRLFGTQSSRTAIDSSDSPVAGRSFDRHGGRCSAERRSSTRGRFLLVLLLLDRRFAASLDPCGLEKCRGRRDASPARRRCAAVERGLPGCDSARACGSNRSWITLGVAPALGPCRVRRLGRRRACQPLAFRRSLTRWPISVAPT